jgi:hypothetical protein
MYGSKTYGAKSYGAKGGSFARYTIRTSAGAFNLTGSNIALRATRLMPVSVGEFSLTGNNVGLNKGFKATVTAGVFNLTGNNANLLHGRKIIAQAGSFNLTGNNINLLWGHKLSASAGNFTLTGKPVLMFIGTPVEGNESIFGSYAPMFKYGNIEMNLDYWVTLSDGPTEDAVIIHESQLTANRAFVHRASQWEFVGTINLFKYEDIEIIRSKLNEFYGFNNKVVNLYKHRDGNPFSFGAQAIPFRLEVIPKNFRTLDYRDIAVLRFTSLYGFDYRDGIIILDETNTAILDETDKAVYGDLL